MGTICCIFIHPLEEGQRISFNLIFVNGVPANGFDFTCSIASCSLKLTGSVLPVDPLDTTLLVGLVVRDVDTLEDLEPIVLPEPLVLRYALPPPTMAAPAVDATVPQFPWLAKSLGELDEANASSAEYAKTVPDATNAVAATVVATDPAPTPLPTAATAAMPANAPPAVATTATAQTATTAAPSAQCHHASPVGSTRLTGLLPQ